ncbi:MAG: class I SAM-dependent methyltransferase, partial [Bacteroidota bacterium]
FPFALTSAHLRTRLPYFFAYLRKVQTRYSVHSPFVYDFILHVLHGTRSPKVEEIESLRKVLGQQTTSINYQDLGAGMEGGKKRIEQASVGMLAQRASRRSVEGSFLLNICRYFQPKRCLELGTHLGISTLYQLAGLQDSYFVSLEGVEDLQVLARQHLETFGFQADLRLGNFDKLLPALLEEQKSPWDYVFIDGNHREESTLRYTQLLLPHMSDGGIMIFDDIHWSSGMHRAWQQIVTMPEVSVSIDLYRMGVCFVNRPQAKEHFTLWM